MFKVPPAPVYWGSRIPTEDDFGVTIKDTFIDGKTRMGPWAIMTPASWARYGMTQEFGLGRGQKYEKQTDGRFKKTEG